MRMILALAGNQNCGKTTLFNVLTGANQHVGNFPGVTVDQTSGLIRGTKDCQIVDLPGIYSIRPYTNEEIVTRDFIINSKPDGILNIVDATNIERNLYLTLQLLELKKPMVIALNMMDEVRENGGFIDIKKMSEVLGVPVVPISAAKDDGISELIDRTLETVENRVLPARVDFCPDGPVHRCIHSVSHVIEDHAEMAGVSARFAATKLIEDDDRIRNSLRLDDNEIELIRHTVEQMEAETGLERNEAIASMRYDFIENLCRETVKKPHESRERRMSLAIDKVITGRFTALPIFVGIMVLTFWLTFGLIGAGLQSLFEMGIAGFTELVDRGLTAYGLNPVVKSLVIDGVFAGVGSMLSFLPVIVVLFFFLSILEDTGYMARVAFVMDRLMRKIGLSGKSFVPMLIGFGCSVPAVMSARTLSSERDRKMTIILVPFMSCSAKIPIYSVFAMAFFKGHAALVMSLLYFGGMVLGTLAALVLRRTAFKGKPVPFVMELPNYRFPSAKSVALLLWEKAKDFITKAFTIIFVGTVIIWFLRTFDTRLNVVEDSSASLLAMLGQLISPVFRPLGFADWRVTTSLICGFTAKEAVISTLGVLTGTSGVSLTGALGTIFSARSAASFLAFTLLYTPCIAAIATIRRELGSKLKTAGVIIFQCVVAWIVGFAVYLIGGLF